MNTSSRYLPGAGLVVVAVFAMLFGLLLVWTFGTTRIESTIRLEEKGLRQMYRQQYAEALDYFRQSALVDTDKFYHMPRYMDSLRLAIQTGDADKAAFFFDEVVRESPDLLAAGEISATLSLQSNPAKATELVVRLAGIEALDKRELDQAVSDYIDSLDEQTRSAFTTGLKHAMPAYRLQEALD